MAEPDDRAASVTKTDTDNESAPIVANGCTDIEENAKSNQTVVTTTTEDDLHNGDKAKQVGECNSADEFNDESDHVAADEDKIDSHTPTLTPVPEDSTEVDDDSRMSVERENGTPNGGGALVDLSVADEMEVDDFDCTQEDDGAGSNDCDESKDVDEDIEDELSVEEDTSQDACETSTNPPTTIDMKADDTEDNDQMTNEDDSKSAEDNDEVQFVPVVQEVHDISDSENDDEISQTHIQPVEHMDNNASAGTANQNGISVLKSENANSLSIESESDESSTDVQTTHTSITTNQQLTQVNDDDDDDEDCVVIEDDDVEDLSQQQNGRKDDDIEEINVDPLAPTVKKQKTGNTGFTIQDARSLAVDPLSFQNHAKNDNSIVIVDTDSIMNRTNAATLKALQNQNISVRPVSGIHNSPIVYPTNIPTSITPVSPITIPPNPSQLNVVTSPAVLPLLPALTDDMFVLEAPSFIVPYIYEKPPTDNLREIVETIRKELSEQKKQGDVDAAEKEAKELEAMSAEQRKLADLAKAADASKKKKSSSKKRAKSGDDSWSESDTSTDDEISDTEQRTKVLIKEIDTDMDAIKNHIQADGSLVFGADNKQDNYFESPLGKFLIDIAVNLVQEHVQTDLLRQQKKRLRREGESAAPSVEMAINSLTKNLEHSKLKNKMFKFEMKRCEYCNFKSESSLSMANHYEAPHLVGQLYKCNFCPFEARPPYDILFHMEAIHNVKARLDKAQTYHQCPNCPFEDNGKSKLARHALVCAKKFQPEVNLNPPLDWEPPAKIPRIKPRHGLVGTATAYQAMAAQAQRSATNAIQQRQNTALVGQSRGRGRPVTITQIGRNHMIQSQPQQHLNRSSLNGINMQNTNFQINAAGQFIQSGGTKSLKSQPSSIFITPLPRQTTANNNNAMNIANMQAIAAASASNVTYMKPGQQPPAGKSAFVICEICDGYIKDLDQLRHHMQWIHEVKIHPKMIYNRPPLNCQKCQFRFFTDQGLERHLLGSHGLVTSSMQEAANKGKDAGRCPICGRFFQLKLLNHVSRDHAMTLKPAHLSYKCTVCTATFGMYKQFENHVYSAHSNVAKKSMDVKSSNCAQPTGSGKSATSDHSNTVLGDSVLKPLKINDEITIIPQPAGSSRQSRGGRSSGSRIDNNVIEIL